MDLKLLTTAMTARPPKENQMLGKKSSKVQVLWAATITIALLATFSNNVLAKDTPKIPDLHTFIESVADNNENSLRGVYAADSFSFEIVQQPAGSPLYVSAEKNVVTEFNAAKNEGNIGLLAHNTAAGASFFELQPGQTVVLVYGNGTTERFLVTKILKYEALNGEFTFGQYRDLATDTVITSRELFETAYKGEKHLTLQTCIENNGDADWGRLFVVAIPVNTSTELPANNY